jgi:hypothetical protein
LSLARRSNCRRSVDQELDHRVLRGHRFVGRAVPIFSSSRQATLNISAIKYELKTNALIKQDYGEIKSNVIEDFALKGEGEEWQKQNIVLSNGVRILARSRGQKVRGLRHLRPASNRSKLKIASSICSRSCRNSARTLHTSIVFSHSSQIEYTIHHAFPKAIPYYPAYWNLPLAAFSRAENFVYIETPALDNR